MTGVFPVSLMFDRHRAAECAVMIIYFYLSSFCNKITLLIFIRRFIKISSILGIFSCPYYNFSDTFDHNRTVFAFSTRAGYRIISDIRRIQFILKITVDSS